MARDNKKLKEELEEKLKKLISGGKKIKEKPEELIEDVERTKEDEDSDVIYLEQKNFGKNSAKLDEKKISPVETLENSFSGLSSSDTRSDRAEKIEMINYTSSNDVKKYKGGNSGVPAMRQDFNDRKNNGIIETTSSVNASRGLLMDNRSVNPFDNSRKNIDGSSNSYSNDLQQYNEPGIAGSYNETERGFSETSRRNIETR